MFSRAAKSAAKNFRQRGYHVAEDKFKKTQAFVLATARSRGPGILDPVVEQKAEKTALNTPKSSEQNGLFSAETKKSSLQKKQSEARKLTSVFRSIPVKSGQGNAANRQLRTFPVARSTHKLGISKQKTETRSSITESAQILGEMGPSSYSRPDYSRTDLEMWLPELTEYFNILGLNDAGRCDYSPPPRVRPGTKKIQSRRRRLKSDRRRAKSAKSATAVLTVCSNQRQSSTQHIRKRRKPVKKAGGKMESRDHVTVRKVFTVSINHTRKSPLADQKKCRRTKSPRSFYKKSVTPRMGNWTVPAILSDRKPIVLHNFENGKKKLKPKLPAGMLRSFQANVLSLPKNKSKTKKNAVSTSHLQRQSRTRTSYGFHKNRKPRRKRRCRITSQLKPEIGDNENFELDVESLEEPYSSVEESSVNNSASVISTVISRKVKNCEESCDPGPKRSSTETLCSVSLVFRDHPLLSVSSINGSESIEKQAAEVCYQDCNLIDCESSDEVGTTVHSHETKESRLEMNFVSNEKSVSYSLKSFYGGGDGVTDNEHAFREPNGFQKASQQCSD